MGDLDAGLFSYLFGSYTSEITLLVQHSGRRLQTIFLQWHSILPNEQHFVVDKQQNCYSISSQEYVAWQRQAILCSNGPHINEANIIMAEQLDRYDLDPLNFDICWCLINLFYITLELSAVDSLVNESIFEVWQLVNGNTGTFGCDLKHRLDHYIMTFHF